MRDDFTAYNHLAMAYTMLHATAMAVKDDATMAFAGEGLKTYAGLVQDINQVIPDAVVQDLMNNDEVPANDPGVADEFRAFVNNAWKSTTNT